MAHFEARSRRWGFMADVQYLNLGTTKVGTGPLGLAFRLDPKVTIVEGAVTYLVPLSDRAAIDVLAGVRAWSYDQRVRILATPLEASRDVSWVDAIAGVRIGVELSPKWVLFARGDIGGFGSEFSWSANGGVAFHASQLISVLAGYRVLDARYKADDSPIPALNLRVYGPALGVGFTF